MRPLLFLLTAALVPAQAAPALDVLLPPGSTIVFGLRAATLLNLVAQQEGAKDLRAQVSGLLAATPFSGFDPFRDIDEVVVAATASGQNPPALVVITGRFDPVKLSQGKGRPYRNALIIQEAKAKQVLAILDETTLLAGDLPLVKAAIDRAASNTAAGPLAARIEGLRTRYDLWAFADQIDTAALAATASAPLPGAADPLRSLDRFSFGAAFAHNFELAAELHLRSAKDAARINDLILEFEKQAKAQINNSPDAKFDIHAADNTITLAISVPEEAWKKALQAQVRPQPKPEERAQPQTITTDSTGNTVTLTLPGKRQ